MRCPGWRPPWAPAEEQARDEGEVAAEWPPVSAARAEPAGARSAAAESRAVAGRPVSAEPPAPTEQRVPGEQRVPVERKAWAGRTVSAAQPRVRAEGWQARLRRERGHLGAGPRDSPHAPDSPRGGGRRCPRGPIP